MVDTMTKKEALNENVAVIKNLLKKLDDKEKEKIAEENHLRKIKEMEQAHRRNLSQKEEKLEKKLNNAERVVKNRRASTGKEIEFRVELQKLKDEEASIKLKRLQQKM